MPVNMDPKNRRRKAELDESNAGSTHEDDNQAESKPFGTENEEDRQKELADAEWKNLWDATEVIDMDTW
ncbi:MAG: hypothetical protein ACREJU_12040 [Nitrospiraceae bacterium]